MSDTEISTEPGTIYFIRERNLITNEVSPFVKIGLTGLHRAATDRRNDLQTGNPRELFVAHEVSVPCVRAVETALRYKFLAQNVNLEWHVFSDQSEDQVKDALDFCGKQKERFAEQTSIFEEAKRLDNTASSGNLIPPTEEATYWRDQYLTHREILKLAKTVATAQQVKAKERFQNGEPLSDGIQIVEKKISEVDWCRFQESYPEICQRYVKCEVSGIFRLQSKISDSRQDADPRISEAKVEVEKFFELFGSEIDHGDPSFLLRQQRIKLQQLTKFSSVEKEIARCHLKVISGTAPGILNICSWVRKLSKPKLDTALLTREHEALLAPFTTYRKLVAATLQPTAGKIAENSKSKTL